MQTHQSGQPTNCSQVSQIVERFESYSVRIAFVPTCDPIADLGDAILSQHTTDPSPARAFAEPVGNLFDGAVVR